MQNDCINVNSGSMLNAQEREVLLRAEIVLTDQGMDEGLQQFATMRDRNMAARQMLADLHDGRCIHA